MDRHRCDPRELDTHGFEATLVVALDQEEVKIASALQAKGFTRPASFLAVVMATRAHARPEDELVEIVKQYPGLESTRDAKVAIRDLRGRGWLHVTTSYNTELIHQAPDLRQKIAKELAIPEVEDQLLKMRASLEPFVTVVGAMNDQEVYNTFKDLLRNAQKSICLPMLATSPYDDVVQILQERANAGVRIRILLGAPNLVARWRGEILRAASTKRIDEWKKLFSKHETVEIRLSDSPHDMALATCLSIDGNVVRFDIYDPYIQRSLEGVMIEVSSPQGMTLNLVRIFEQIFDEAWDRALPARRWAIQGRFIRRWWTVWIGLAFIGLAYLPVSFSWWKELMIGLSAGVLAPTFIEEGPKAWKRLRSKRSG